MAHAEPLTLQGLSSLPEPLLIHNPLGSRTAPQTHYQDPCLGSGEPSPELADALIHLLLEFPPTLHSDSSSVSHGDIFHGSHGKFWRSWKVLKIMRRSRGHGKFWEVLESKKSSGGHGKFWRAWKVLEGRERNGNLIRPNKKVVRKIKNRPSDFFKYGFLYIIINSRHCCNCILCLDTVDE